MEVMKEGRIAEQILLTLRNGLQTLAAVSGIESYTKFNRSHVNYHDQFGKIFSLEDLFPYLNG
jgi:hypothetical protein